MAKSARPVCKFNRRQVLHGHFSPSRQRDVQPAYGVCPPESYCVGLDYYYYSSQTGESSRIDLRSPNAVAKIVKNKRKKRNGEKKWTQWNWCPENRPFRDGFHIKRPRRVIYTYCYAPYERIPPGGCSSVVDVWMYTDRTKTLCSVSVLVINDKCVYR